MAEPQKIPQLEIKPHYPFATRLLIDLFNTGELPAVREISIEPEYGFVGRLIYQDFAVRMFRGTDLGVNASSATQIAKDKGYTKHFLKQLGYHTPRGKVFLLPQYVQTLEKVLSRHAFAGYIRVEGIEDYITSTIGYPCFIKPNDGSMGEGVTKCIDKDDVQFTVAQYQEKQVKVLLVEEALEWPDYRVVVYKDAVVACYLRTPLAVKGDGRSTIKELLLQKYEQFNRAGRSAVIDFDDTRIARRLFRKNYTLETVLAEQEICPLQAIANLSAGGDVEDFTARICQHWSRLCIRLTAAMGLELCGVDIMCSDIENENAEYSILEINGTPALANYAAAGKPQLEKVRRLYKMIFAH